MTAGTGVKTAFDASVFAASGGAFMLATARRYAWSVDEAMSSAASQKHPLNVKHNHLTEAPGKRE